MRIINNVDVDAFLRGELELNFRDITLLQNVSHNPVRFSGPGTVSLNNGKLNYILHHTPQGDESSRLFQNSSSSVAGELVGQDQSYSFSGRDIYGQMWTATEVSADGGIYTQFASVIKGFVDCLKLAPTDVKERPASIHYVLAANKHFPTPRIIPANGFEFCVSGAQVHLVSDEDGCDVSIRNGTITVSFGQAILNVLDILTGTLMQVAVAEFVCDGQRWVELYSIDVEGKLALLPPIELEFPRESILLGEIFSRLHPFAVGSGGKFYDYWFKLNRAWQGGLQSTGLTIGIYIEGILRDYFGDLGTDPEFHAMAESALPKIEKLEVPKRIIELLKASIGNAGHFKAKSALHKLTEAGAISPGLIGQWTRLRNDSAHAVRAGAGTAARQKLVHLTFSNLKLFYELLFHLAEYKGDRIDYGTRGFPSIPALLESSQAAQEIPDGHFLDTSAVLKEKPAD